MRVPRAKCPDGHKNTAYLGRDAYGNDVYECYGCERSRSKVEFKFVVLSASAGRRR